ncbi:hypothetical protein SteCoe_5711 [Stentor coeruleus]|uniref:t-SNARE coiled-coil homology domain-containing protein n=1 Tax=Stentor coeruleus TaxID=5963 RepID=A0A1R2CRP5_9CILI|nr:hypothetical protein SteCoe_5711 [Stentor coeruleus]
MMHEDLVKQQDQQIDEINEIALRLHNHANIINTELKDQHVMIEKLSGEVYEKLEKKNFVMKKIWKLLKTNGNF